MKQVRRCYASRLNDGLSKHLLLRLSHLLLLELLLLLLLLLRCELESNKARAVHREKAEQKTNGVQLLPLLCRWRGLERNPGVCDTKVSFDVLRRTRLTPDNPKTNF